ncbi:homeodomain-like protein [Vibrio phage 1.079.O._10N.286.45.E9]|nr:homeodomain-like protein [Vibrio phage 1.079.O._10N.286.45.E9]
MKGIIDRFNDGITINKATCCWEVEPTARGGYGKISMLGKTMLYHRASFELHVGKIPDGMMVCHKCDNPRCVNPIHLFIGTAKDNMDDKIAKGRHVGAKKGSNHHGAKLVEWQVKEIKNLLNTGESQYKIAEMYGVSQTSINNIKTGKRWKYV